eukprot:gene10900-10982_t
MSHCGVSRHVRCGSGCRSAWESFMRRLIFATVSLAAAAAVHPVMAQPAPTQTLRIALAEDGDILDPSVARTFVGRIVFAGMCDKLFDINEKLEIVPQLATGFEYTDSKTLIISLRAGVKFHDGTDMDAAAVKYSLERHVNFPGSTRKAELGAMDKIEVIDPLKVKVTLKAPSAPFVAQLTDRAGMIVSPKAAEAAGKDFGLKPVCAGPFKFVERVAQDHITMERFPEYWDAKNVHFAKVVYQVIVDNSVRLANLQAGAIEIGERIGATDVEAARKDPKLNTAVFPSLGFQSINFNVANGPKSKGPFGNALVRKAFELSIDRTALMQVVYNGLYPPTVQAIPGASPFHNAALKVPERDVAKAKALLAQAGVKAPVPVTLTVSTSPDQKQVGEVIQSMVAEAGFDLKVQATEFASMLSAESAGDYEASAIGWSGRADPDGNLYSFMYTGAPLNDWKYSDKEVDTWLDGARATTDAAERKALYAKITAKLAQDLPVMYLDNNPWITVSSKKLTGFRPVADGMIRIPGMELANILVFCLQQLMPGDPALVLAGEERDPAVLAAIRTELWLDRSLPIQYLHWIGGVLQGDLGFSWRIRQPVIQLVLTKLPVTLQLGCMAFVISVCIGIPMGILSAVKRNTKWDYIANGVGLAGLSTPNFWLGIMLILLISVRLGWLPPSGYVSLAEDWRQARASWRFGGSADGRRR